jgi:hypothetical protein
MSILFSFLFEKKNDTFSFTGIVPWESKLFACLPLLIVLIAGVARIFAPGKFTPLHQWHLFFSLLSSRAPCPHITASGNLSQHSVRSIIIHLPTELQEYVCLCCCCSARCDVWDEAACLLCVLELIIQICPLVNKSFFLETSG